MLRTEAIKKFLHSQPYDMCKLYTPDMEVQVNVAKDNGEIVEGKYNGKPWFAYTDGFQRWKHLRIPWNADNSPTYEDKEITFDISQHAEAIGMTGWDWKNKCSRWFGYDFDSFISHKKGLTEQELLDIKNRLFSIPFVTIYTSTSGNGLHVYVQTKILSVDNHNKHSQYAKAILNRISYLIELDLNVKVDTLGGILWVWHRKAITDKSYKCVKQGEVFTEELILPPSFEEEKQEHKTTTEDITASRNIVELDEEHLQVLRWFEQSDSLWWWNDEKQMLVCHTHDLCQAHKDLKLRGFFETISTGKQHGKDQNCFCFPLKNGSWIVRRHTKGTSEHDSWFKDTKGYTACYFNKLAELKRICKAFNAIEGAAAAGSSTYTFKCLEDAIKVLNAIGINFDTDIKYYVRPARLQELKDNKIKLLFKADEDDSLVNCTMEKDNWVQYFFRPRLIEDSEIPDDLIRYLTINGVEFGWFVFTNNDWVQTSKHNIISSLKAYGYKLKDIDAILGNCINNNWKMVIKPFQPEYPGNREWNKGAPQFRFQPQQGEHPTWDLVLNHCGESLNESLSRSNIKKYLIGKDYLQTWIAALINNPSVRLPYLFFIGPQNSGKSTFHECLAMLFSSGYCRADQALTSPTGFNGELINAIICVIEEVNLSKRGWAYDRIKDWVTGESISIHIKGKTPFTIPNTTHWIQCANDIDYCPVLPGDTRITVIRVPKPNNDIPKYQILKQCEEEAPAFLYTLLNMKLPPQEGRLGIPVIETEDKLQLMESNKTELDSFIEMNVFAVPGHTIKFSEFFNTFIQFVDPTERSNWSSKRVAKALPFIRGRMGGEGHIFIGNITFDENAVPKKEYKSINGRLTND